MILPTPTPLPTMHKPPEDLYDTKGNRIGRVLTGANGAQELYDQRGNRLGKFEPVANRTLDMQGRPVAIGNQLLRLLK